MKKGILFFFLFVFIHNIFAQTTGRAIANIKYKGKWGVMDDKGKWIIQPKYESLGIFYGDIIPAKIKGKWGAINTEEKWVVKPEYQQLYDFNEGIAIVIKSSGPPTIQAGEELHYGMVDTKGKEVIPLVFTQLDKFSDDGLALAQTKVGGEKKFGYIGRDGHWIIRPVFYDAYDFSCGRAVVSNNSMGLYYFINKKGQRAFEIPLNMNIRPRGVLANYADCMARVWEGKRPVFIDTSGKVILRLDPSVTAILGNFSEDRCPVEVGIKNGFVNGQGNIIIKPVYDYVSGFHGGIAVAAIDMKEEDGSTEKKGGKYGFINNAGEWIGKPEYEMAYAPEEGISIVSKNKKYGFVDSTGHIINTINYDQVRNFSCGYGAIKLKGKWGFINKKGKTIILPVYDEIKNFTNVNF
jgi:hypothetical protein